MNNRLERIRRLIPKGRGFADIGTDHGYLPVQMAKDGYSGEIFASDIRPGPLSAAIERARKEGVDERIVFSLCDGLDACPPERIDTIVIAGMGGDTICGILDRAEWCMSEDYLLVLQPMTKAEILRFWLINNGFVIEEEFLAQEGDTLYQILTARFQNINTALLDAELYLGSVQKHRGDPLFPLHVRQQRSRLETSLAGMQSAALKDELRMRFLSAVISEMYAIEEKCHDEGF